ncbi:urease accessory protein UreF [Natronobiforma cellulositropha]|uniref:urease accessory protein UreF n=1 Tax=Natronobiforma cellulositropha TaxID=1679076 RepID=UPI0021D5CE1D|nr:urease accessory UreF family protein [Natronobiforma cellulositropha]
MPTDSSAFLTALRLADSSLPVGSYTASYGIEQYANEGLLEEVSDLRAVVEAYLERVVGPCETVAVANAHAASADGDLDGVLAVDERLHAVTLPREFRESSTRAGGQFCDLLLAAADGEAVAPAYATAVEAGTTPGHYAVCFGVYTQAAGLECEVACLTQGYAFLVSLLGAAQRLGRFGHTDVQSVLESTLPVLEEVCARHVETPLGEMGAFAPFAEAMGMRHERATRRLFMS